MTVYISLGSNLGNRIHNLEQAIKGIVKKGFKLLKISPVYETKALLPSEAETDWNKSFLNAVIAIECEENPLQLLHHLKTIEKRLGRKPGPRWSPRIIDLDILLFGEEIINTPELKIPHPEITNRDFVLVPLKELNSSLKIPGVEGNKSVLDLCRSLKMKIPTWMHILNITPDSFSDGGELNLDKFNSVLEQILKHSISIVDLGAESTRPKAIPVSPKEEWQRLKHYMDYFFDFYKDKLLRPKLSIDTRHPQTAKKAIDGGVDIINDVSGLSEEMQDLIAGTDVEYILMHSLTVPADPDKTLPGDEDPVEEIKKWLYSKINILEKKNIPLHRVIFDPGIGFGKSAEQSLEILNRVEEFYCVPLRIMVGHSRKSFMKLFASCEAKERDPESAGVSLSLVEKGVDILRVHSADFHVRVLRGFVG